MTPAENGGNPWGDDALGAYAQMEVMNSADHQEKESGHIVPMKAASTADYSNVIPFSVFQARRNPPLPWKDNENETGQEMKIPGCGPVVIYPAVKTAPAAPEKSGVNLAAAVNDKIYRASISTFRMLIEKDYNGLIRHNVMTGKPEYYDKTEGKWEEWTDVNEAQMRDQFQNVYGLYHEKMLRDALQIYFQAHQVNPLIDLLESLSWDGKPRICAFLHDILQCSDTPYYREVSRLIFAGGIHRAYRPGCKFDDMIVLVGQQGGGKSTVVRMLNMEDRFFREIKTITGKEGVEALRGVWIGEMAELLAMTRVREAEAVKAFITAQEDSYRAPYARYVETIPRRCTFLGTTNNSLFLSDKTGNRRFYPVQCHSDGYDLLSHEKEVRAYIRQCWAEAVALYKNGELKPYADKSVLPFIRAEQENAMEDDWRIGAITQYLDQMKEDPKSTVSVIELWRMALAEPEDRKPTRKDSIEIAQIMDAIGGWKRAQRLENTRWGRQKVFEKVENRYPF